MQQTTHTSTKSRLRTQITNITKNPLTHYFNNIKKPKTKLQVKEITTDERNNQNNETIKDFRNRYDTNENNK